MRELSAQARVFVLLVVGGAVAAALLLLVVAVHGPAPRSGPAAGVLAALVVLAELRPFLVTRDDNEHVVTLSTGFALALTLVGGLGLAVLAMCASVVVADLRQGKSAVRWAFNAAQYCLCLVVAGSVFSLLTSQPVLRQPAPLAVPGQLWAVLAAGVAFAVVNNGLTATVIALALREPVLPRLTGALEDESRAVFLELTFAPVVVVCAELSAWLLPLLVLPMAGIYVSAELARRRQAEGLQDSLTGLPNRTRFGSHVARACAGRTSRSAVVLLDLDHFREINDTLGHSAGDQLLQAVAERLTQGLRPGDTVARLGGDEFAVLSEGLHDSGHAVAVGERVLAALSEPFEVQGVRLDVSASLGVAVHPDDGEDAGVLLRRADIALYAAKAQRSCVRRYDSSHDPHSRERLALASDLRAGLDQHQLRLHHQPQVDVTTGRVLGFEALVRWQHPRHGLLMPDDFLPVVENTGLIGPMTLEVLDLALADVAAWRRQGHALSVAVNLSVRHLTDLALPSQVGARLAAHGLPASALVLEVTETLIMTDPARVVAVLGELRELGVGLAVDDFGTGYSSLAYLRRLHVDELKIDRSFVRDLARSGDDAVIVRSTIELGHSLGLRLVAEGVEDEAALDLLREWGCDAAQGYLLARPMPAEQVLPWLATRTAASGVALAWTG